MPFKKIAITLPLFLLTFYFSLQAQTIQALPRSVPEAEGVSSEGILQFLEAAGKGQHEFHSFMVLRHGKVIAEGWWNPYRADLKHTMYSVSKSFTATAVGFAVSEKRLSVEDKVISFFPKDLPDTIAPFLSALRVRDLLSMSVGQEPDPTFSTVSRDSNWVKSFLALPILHAPGSQFLYNSLATYMLSAIVQKVTGQKVIDYLRPRLFQPLGITGIDWEVDPQDINTGGWGLRLKTEDMAKFGQLFLQKGQWAGQQVLSKDWVEAASTLKIVQHPDLLPAKKDSSDWEQGYCYQMWRCRHNAFRADGAYGQYIVVMPDQDAVVVITSETPDLQGELNLVWQYLLPAMQAEKLPDNSAGATRLKRKLSSLALPLSTKFTDSPLASAISGETFSMAANQQGIQSISLRFQAGLCQLRLKTDTTTFPLVFSSDKWIPAETTRHGPNLFGGAKANQVGLPLFKVAGNYRWTDDHTLELTLRYLESPHTETFTCHFEKANVSVEYQYSFDKSRKQVLKGTL